MGLGLTTWYSGCTQSIQTKISREAQVDDVSCCRQRRNQTEGGAVGDKFYRRPTPLLGR
jgi:hypothetical protein